MERAEATGFGIAVVGHAALLAVLTLGLAKIARPPAPAAPMEVSFVDDAGLVSAAPEPSSEAPAIGAAPDTGPIEDAATPAPPSPAPPLPPAPVARAPAPPPQRTRPRQPPPAPKAGTRSNTRRPLTGEILDGIGEDRVSTSNRPPAAMTGAARSSIRSLIAGALRPCQRQPLPADEAAVIRVNYRITLNRDGSLAAAEFQRLINPNPALERYERRMRDLALNVINSCQGNFRELARRHPELYDVAGGWRQFPYQFDPRTTR